MKDESFIAICDYASEVYTTTPRHYRGLQGYAGRDFYLLTAGEDAKLTYWDGIKNPLCRVSGAEPTEEEWGCDVG
jgi:hypothetical protein